MIRIEKAVFMISVSISSENVGGVKFKFCEEIEPYQQPSPVKIKEDPTGLAGCGMRLKIGAGCGIREI